MRSTIFGEGGTFVRLWGHLSDTGHAPILLPGFPEYREREPGAESIKLFCGLLLNGLFQTPDTIQTIMQMVNEPSTAAEQTTERLDSP